jgi:cytochrome d ubiquinol oxidase subunit I
MDPVLLARIQFAMTIGFHFIFPPITIGMAWLIFYFMTQYKKTDSEEYAAQVRFWLKLFAITFAVGVATGITMEFQFGTNWAEYSKFVGDIFGAPLAAEGILAFFLESTFMGVLLFGWKRFSKKVLWVSSLLVAAGSTLSAFWIIVANSWMQTPAGYHIVNGRAELTNFWAAVFNPSTLPRYVHTIDACMITGAFFMLGISAWYLLKEQHVQFAKRSFTVSLIAAFVFAGLQLPLGHWHAVQVTETQPTKLAAFEGLWETRTHAPALFFGIPNEEKERTDFAIGIPSGLSILISGKPGRKVQGLKDFPRDEWPPLKLSFFSFHSMFFLGMYFIVLSTLGIFLLWRKKLFINKFFMKLCFFSIPLPIIANEIGWIAAEVGRQPWIVYGVPGMRTRQAVSITVTAGEILTSIILFGLMYLLLGVLWIYLLRKDVIKGPDQVVTENKEVAV